MWCVVEQEDVPLDKLENSPSLGWIHSPEKIGRHTVEGVFLDDPSPPAPPRGKLGSHGGISAARARPVPTAPAAPPPPP
jgi:hypothetical protein